MSGRAVRDVMTDMVIVVREETGYKEIVDALADFSVSAVPVVDADGRVLGIVSEADLLYKIEFSGTDAQVRLFDRARTRSAKQKAAGDTAGDLMSAPAITIHPSASIGEAARTMEKHNVKRLPVVDADGRLVGIVSRRDVLRVFLRPDGAIRNEIISEVLIRTLAIEPAEVDLEVANGVVTYTGQVDRRSTKEILLRLTRATPGVVDVVVDDLSYRYDDADDISHHYVFDANV